MTTVEFLDASQLHRADDGSWFTYPGAGGDLLAWVTGIGEMLADEHIGAPIAWYQTNGASINQYAMEKRGSLQHDDAFPGDIMMLMFPLVGLHVGRLAVFKIKFGARWFDDVIANMRP